MSETITTSSAPRAPLNLEELILYRGAHDPGDNQHCVIEAVAHMAGEPWSDCTCPVISEFCLNYNDALDDEPRQRLKPYIPRMIGSKSTPAVEDRRAWMATDWLVRTYTPAWLRLAGPR